MEPRVLLDHKDLWALRDHKGLEEPPEPPGHKDHVDHKDHKDPRVVPDREPRVLRD